jgi:predicted nucleic acid-binding Zn ribbon protein
VGWRIKLMHRAWQDVRVARETLRTRQGQRRQHTIMALFFAIATVLVLYVVLRI